MSAAAKSMAAARPQPTAVPTGGGDIHIASIAKNSREEIRVSLGEFRGVRLINLRVWYCSPGETMKPGRDGLALRIDRLDALQDAVAAAVERAREIGWLA